ncbi:MAG: outer membrane protein assembly factor BamD [Proteobacteria bacterium]|nr:outer membrane protein assembly factor BamD [Pseudomonadota bacterium]
MRRRQTLVSRIHLIIPVLAILTAGIFGCSSTREITQTPDSLLDSARHDIRKHRYELAIETLEKLRPVTAETRLGGEVQFLLAEARFQAGKYPEAEMEYGAYLDLYPEGSFREDALYKSALSKVRQIQKTAVGLFYLRTYIPSDRDISSLRQTRSLLEKYIEEYPEGKGAGQGREMAERLRIKEGEHELEIMAFYLKKKQPQAVLARAQRILADEYSERIKSEAREMAGRARELEAEKGNTPTR